MESYRIETPEYEKAMTIDRHTTRQNADNRLVADDQQEIQKRPYEAPELRRHARLPVITAGSISKAQWGIEQT